MRQKGLSLSLLSLSFFLSFVPSLSLLLPLSLSLSRARARARSLTHTQSSSRPLPRLTKSKKSAPKLQGDGWTPIFASPKVHSGQKAGEKELWPMLFEKVRDAHLHIRTHIRTHRRTHIRTHIRIHIRKKFVMPLPSLPSLYPLSHPLSLSCCLLLSLMHWRPYHSHAHAVHLNMECI